MAAEKNSRLVYSTDGTDAGRVEAKSSTPSPSRSPSKGRSAARPGASGAPSRPQPPADGFVRLQREKKGRGGKTVTIVTGLPGGLADREALLKVLKQHCGAGGTVEGETLEIQGDHRERIRAKLESLGHRVKLAGG
jgi:translation initiation factor 1